MDKRLNLDIYKALPAVNGEVEIQLLDAEQNYLTEEEKRAITQEVVEVLLLRLNIDSPFIRYNVRA